MKTSTKTLTYAAIASIAFLACDDTGTNNNIEQGGSTSSSSSDLLSSSSTDNCVANEYEDGSVEIDSVVKKWMEKQLVSGENDRILIYVHDYYAPEYESGAGFRDVVGCVEMCYFLDDRTVDKKEFDEWVEKFRKEMEEKRGITPMGEIIIGGSGSGWVAAMTAEEIVELTGKCKKLSIEFYSVAITYDP